jgi:hypothetical protein
MSESQQAMAAGIFLGERKNSILSVVQKCCHTQKPGHISSINEIHLCGNWEIKPTNLLQSQIQEMVCLKGKVCPT